MINSKPKELARLLNDGANRTNRVSSWLRRIGLEAEFTGGKVDKGGLYGIGPSAFIHVSGEPGAALLFLSATAGPGEQFFESNAVLYLHKNKTKVLATGDLGATLQPRSAYRVGSKLVVSGIKGWFGNGPRPSVEVYSGSQRLGGLMSWGENYEPVKLRLNRDTLAPAYVTSFTYPPNMSVCHADAAYKVEEKWTFDGGVPRIAWRRALATPFNTLDSLIVSLRKNRLEDVRKRCVSEKVYRKVLRLRNSLGPDQPDVAARKGGYQINDEHWLSFVRTSSGWKVFSVKPLGTT